MGCEDEALSVILATQELTAYVVEYDMPIVDIYCLAEDENMAAVMGKHGYPEGNPFTINPVNEDDMESLLWTYAVRGYIVVQGNTLRRDVKDCPFVPYQTREEKINLLLP